MQSIYDSILKYSLIGIGEFSHGIQESWDFRFNLLKYTMLHTNKNIVIFNEMSIWQADNIMNNTIWSTKLNKPIHYKGIKIEQPIQNKDFVGGVLWQYCNHTSESNIFLKIIKYIRKNKNRITIIGIDNDKIDRDYDMFKIVKCNMNPINIHFIWAHNDHICDRVLSNDNLVYITNKNHKYSMGHYLRTQYKYKYCIILSQAYEGENRFNSYCIGSNCKKRLWGLKYFYKKFKYNPCKQYLHHKPCSLLTNYKEPFINFSNSYYKKNKSGIAEYTQNDERWNYVLFWNIVSRLVPLNTYHNYTNR